MPTSIIVPASMPVFTGTYWHWGMDEGSGTTWEEDIVGKDLTTNADYVAGKNGYLYAGSLTGNDWGYLSDSDFNMGTYGWSGAAWVMINDWTSVLNGIFKKSVAGSHPEGYDLTIQGTDLSASVLALDIHTVSPDTTWGYSVTIDMPKNELTHLAFSFDRTYLRVWKNGAYLGKSAAVHMTTGKDYDNAATFYIGVNIGIAGWYRGTLDDVWLMKDKLISDEEALQLYKYLG